MCTKQNRKISTIQVHWLLYSWLKGSSNYKSGPEPVKTTFHATERGLYLHIFIPAENVQGQSLLVKGNGSWIMNINLAIIPWVLQCSFHTSKQADSPVISTLNFTDLLLRVLRSFSNLFIPTATSSFISFSVRIHKAFHCSSSFFSSLALSRLLFSSAIISALLFYPIKWNYLELIITACKYNLKKQFINSIIAGTLQFSINLCDALCFVNHLN